MKTVMLEKENPSIGELASRVSREAILVTRENRPVLAVIPVCQEDLQTWDLGENPEFLELMRQSWERLQAEGALSLADAQRQLLSEKE